ncbi:ATP-binding cassette subfamily B protein [Keratinibaculum paraultunense]|uniref:ATP-binding cassette subfamily B protein n=1 Tax=Keratinibaculum paraultunense TaxID=1278232 RepID=A0A4R3KZI2_9FIRM|nr:ABC transporter ATP-binding protein [Keratinibaculum paraultunense]TCS90476.1 ATP-binding cassette subfamily B protein [Keratinibaculum paraultunense]
MGHKHNSKRPAGISGGRRAIVPVEKPKDMKHTLKRLWEYFKYEKFKLFIVFMLVIVSGLLNLTAPFLIGKAVDFIFPGKGFVEFVKLKKIIILLISIYMLNSLLIFLQEYMVAGLSQRVVYNIRESIFSKLQKLSLVFFDTHTHGELMSRLTNDVDNISVTISQSIIQLMSSVVNIVGSLIMMIYLSPIMTVVSLITVPMVYVLTKTIANKTKILFKEQQDALGVLNGHIEETIGGIYEVKIFNKEDKVIDEFIQNNKVLKEVGVQAQIWSGFIMPLMNVISNFGFTVVAIFGGILSVKGKISVGVIASFISYSKQFTKPLNELASTFNTLQSGIAGAERVFEILDEQEERKDFEDAIAAKDIKGEVEFKNVSFQYEEGKPVLKNISFKVKPGDTVALVGPTGAGKTTIVNLLTGFYEVEKGEILIDGINIKKYKKDSLREIFGIVLQDTYLFSGTIKENIKYGRLDATDDEIKRAAKIAGADDFINRLSHGYNTMLYEGGMNLSEGQRQLIAIARVVLAEPSILILDEATSNIDTRTEFKIQKAMEKLMENRTTFMIAHRLSTIRDADMIMVIDKGQIIEKGNHKELLSQKGIYYNLYTSQFVDVG